jgi:hypothetical protein
MRRRIVPPLAVTLAFILSGACVPPEAQNQPRLTLFLGIDVSGSFQRTGHFDDALNFAAHYIYGHLNELGGLEKPRALFVASIGGEQPGQPKSFHPIHDFQGKSVEEIEASLRQWFKPDDRFTDFNPFFERVATLVKRQDLILTPIAVVVISDGVPDVTTRQVSDASAPFRKIDVSQLEFLSRSVTVRLLYATPGVSVRWERDIPRQRVRIWTVDSGVMEGWHAQMAPNVPLDRQDQLWKWVSDNVDFRVRRRLL